MINPQMLLHLFRFGTTWHVVVGEGFGFDISYEVNFYENGYNFVFFNRQGDLNIKGPVETLVPYLCGKIFRKPV